MKANRLSCGLALLAAVMVAGCQNPGIVQVSPNTYMLSREDHAGIFGSMSALKAGVIRDANVFAEKQGKVAIPISAKEHGVGILEDWASFELTFKVVNRDDPEAHGTNILTSSSLEGAKDGATSAARLFFIRQKLPRACMKLRVPPPASS